MLGIKLLTDDQQRILLSIRDNRETNVPSAHGMGKTKTGAIASLWWVFCCKGLAITTAPTERQVKELLWSEIRSMYDAHQHKLGGERGQLFVKLNESARAFGFTAKDYDPNAFQGIHHERLLIVQDESCGITQSIDEGASACITGTENRILRIGNPVVPGTPFEAACKRSSIRIPAWNHPNVSWAYGQDPDGIHRLKPEVKEAITSENGEILPQSQWADWCQRDVIPGAISIEWIEDTRRRRGEGSAYWQSRVQAFFPHDNADSIIPRSWFNAARARYDTNRKYWDNLAAAHKWRHGLDVGDGGDDHAIASWRGAVLYAVEVIPTKGDREDVTRAAGLAKQKLQECPGVVAVDRAGVGSGSLASLLEQKLPAVGIHWGSAATKAGLYQNLKAQQYWELREAFRTGEVAISPLGDCEEMLMEDLAGTFYDVTSTGKTRIEDKSSTKRRLHRSPNAGDAVVLGFHAKLPIKPPMPPSVSYRTW